MGDSRDDSFRAFFQVATATTTDSPSIGFTPYDWQLLVAVDGLPDVLPVPTGLGKTEVALAWAWRLLVDNKPEPRHLVICLPMRSLVSQTVHRLTGYFDALRAQKPEIDVRVHQLMGGAIDEEWARWPDKPWVLIGTQNQRLPRTLNCGYAMSRVEWPVHLDRVESNHGFHDGKVRWAQANEIAAFKTRRRWCIKRAELDERIDMQPHGDAGERDGE